VPFEILRERAAAFADLALGIVLDPLDFLGCRPFDPLDVVVGQPSKLGRL
jgi:hypothetical protein